MVLKYLEKHQVNLITTGAVNGGEFPEPQLLCTFVAQQHGRRHSWLPSRGEAQEQPYEQRQRSL